MKKLADNFELAHTLLHDNNMIVAVFASGSWHGQEKGSGYTRMQISGRSIPSFEKKNGICSWENKKTVVSVDLSIKILKSGNVKA